MHLLEKLLQGRSRLGAEVRGMSWWAIIGWVTGILQFIYLFVPITLHWRAHVKGLQASVDVRVHMFPFTIHREVDIAHNVGSALEHMLKRWMEKGEPVKVPVQKTVEKLPVRTLLHAVKRPLRWLGRRVRCRKLLIAHEVGGSDAMETALVAGASWSVMGTIVGNISRFVRMDADAPLLQVVPNYGGRAWRLETHCILRVASGYATIAGVWLLFRVLANREIRTWALHSWRRKGVEGSGRASDPGPDEDGHGEP
jgi:hypothetical protein